MKRTDVTKQVMDSVIQFEENRSKKWFQKYWIILLLLFGGIGYALFRIVTGYMEWDAEFMASWYFEDWEVFKIVWMDAFDFIWSLVPQYWVYILVVCLIGCVIIILATSTMRKKIKRTRVSIRLYKHT